METSLLRLPQSRGRTWRRQTGPRMSETGSRWKSRKKVKTCCNLFTRQRVFFSINITHLRAGLGNEPKTRGSYFNRLCIMWGLSSRTAIINIRTRVGGVKIINSLLYFYKEGGRETAAVPVMVNEQSCSDFDHLP